MEFIRYKTKEEFLNENLEILLKDEEKNEIMIGILLEHDEEVIKKWVLGRIENNGEVKAVFLVEDERQGLLIYSLEKEMSEETVSCLVENLINLKVNLKEVLTSKENSVKIGNLYAQKNKKQIILDSNMNIMIYDNKEEENLLNENERIEKVEKGDIDDKLLKENTREMYQDNFRGRECSENDIVKTTEAFLKKGLYILRNENYDIVSQAVTVRKQINCCAIGGVITFKKYRGYGYARRLVHTLCNMLLKKGYKSVVLHVNSKNEPAISLYSKIGFKKIDETIKVKFI